MARLYLYNTLTKKKEKFVSRNPPLVKMYSCGPTVYDVAHIGNFRTYTLHDLLHRTLEFFDYKVVFVSNVTDVGHLVSDADEGEDKLEKGARREGTTAWEVAQKYTDLFLSHEKELNILPPDIRCRATDYIKEQIKLVQTLEKKGFAYQISDGLYFDTSKFENYGSLIGLNKESLREGARVKVNKEKRNPADFALWKFSPKKVKRDMEWDSPWGKGFPGWHIECSAMGMKHLGTQFDIHVGGIDIKSTHHVNEIAQSEAATGKSPFVGYWVHGELLKVDGGRMGKSLGNAYSLEDIKKKNITPLALRYLYLSAHYRDTLNFTWQGLRAAEKGLERLKNQVAFCRQELGRTTLSVEKRKKVEEFQVRFASTLADDLNAPKALAVLWEVLKSNIPPGDKYELALSFDEVLGFGLRTVVLRKDFSIKIPSEIKTLVEKRDNLRRQNEFGKADKLRRKIEKHGYLIKDTKKGARLEKI